MEQLVNQRSITILANLLIVFTASCTKSIAFQWNLNGVAIQGCSNDRCPFILFDDGAEVY